jgi:HK97 family phage major capsid protein
MATEIELKSAARSLGEQIQGVINDAEMSVSEKGAKLDKLQEESERIGAELKNLERARSLMSGIGAAEDSHTEQGSAAGPVYRSLGEEALASEAYKMAVRSKGGRYSYMTEVGMKTQGATNMMGESTSGTTAGSALSGYFLAGTAGPAILPNFLPGIVEQRFFPLTIADLFAAGATDSPVISYLKETAWTNSSAATGEGATMPYSTDAIARVQEQVGKVTNVHKITDEMLQDASQYVSFLNNRLVFGVQRQEEVQILAGSGYPGVNGLLARTSGFTVAPGVAAGGTAITGGLAFPASGTAGAGESSSTVSTISYGREAGTPNTPATALQIADGLFGAITDIRFTAFCEPDAFVVNPFDWQTIRLGKDNQNQYLGGSFFGADYGQPQNAGESLWGKKVVVTPVIPQGYILVGAFKENGQLFRSKGITVEMVNTNGTDFEQGLVSMRATSRLALAVYRPQAFELVKLSTSTS